MFLKFTTHFLNKYKGKKGIGDHGQNLEENRLMVVPEEFHKDGYKYGKDEIEKSWGKNWKNQMKDTIKASTKK